MHRAAGGSYDSGSHPHRRLGGGLAGCRRCAGRRPPGQGQGDRICEDLHRLWRRLLSTFPAPTPASSSAAICAPTPLSTAASTAQPSWNGDLGQQNRFRDYFISRSRMALSVDTRTATEYGLVRTYGQGYFQFNNFGNSNPATAIISPPPGGFNSALLSTAGGGYVAVEFLFLQFAGFTFGKSASAYATPWQVFPGQQLCEPAGRSKYRYRHQQHPVPGASSATAFPPPSVSTIRRCGTARRSTISASPPRSAPTARARTPPRRACARYRRQHPRRSGLGPVAALGRRA